MRRPTKAQTRYRAKMNCERKRQSSSKKTAEDAMFSYYRRAVGKKIGRASVYKCGDHWHWGHNR